MIGKFARNNRALVAAQTRAFGGGAPHDPNHVYQYPESASHDGTKTRLKVPGAHDVAFQLPKKGTRNEWFHMWLQGKWNPIQDEKLDNSKVNRYSAYYFFGNVVPG